MMPESKEAVGMTEVRCNHNNDLSQRSERNEATFQGIASNALISVTDDNFSNHAGRLFVG
jgi:hypothetical protein